MPSLLAFRSPGMHHPQAVTGADRVSGRAPLPPRLSSSRQQMTVPFGCHEALVCCVADHNTSGPPSAASGYGPRFTLLGNCRVVNGAVARVQECCRSARGADIRCDSCAWLGPEALRTIHSIAGQAGGTCLSDGRAGTTGVGGFGKWPPPMAIFTVNDRTRSVRAVDRRRRSLAPVAAMRTGAYTQTHVIVELSTGGPR